MTIEATTSAHSHEDPVSNVLKWLLLAVAVICFALLGWSTSQTYQAAPPIIPSRFLAPDGTELITASNIEAGKTGFQRADLMDYGSLYGVGLYFGEDYTAANLVKLATLTESYIGQARSDQAPSALALEDQRAYLQ